VELPFYIPQFNGSPHLTFNLWSQVSSVTQISLMFKSTALERHFKWSFCCTWIL